MNVKKKHDLTQFHILLLILTCFSLYGESNQRDVCIDFSAII